MNTNYRNMNDRFTLLTRLTRRFGFNSRGFKSICVISSSAYVRHSRGEIDRIKRWFVINPTPIGSQSSLNAGDHEELKILLKNHLIPSRFNQELRYKGREEHRFIEKVCENRGPFNILKIGWTVPNACSRWATIPWRGPTISLFFRPSDFDRTIMILPRVSPWWALRVI